MKTIYKYGINAGFTKLELPRGARIFSANYDPQGILSVWAAIDTEEKEIETHTLYLTGTGWSIEELDSYNYRFINTAIDEEIGLVWHIFEVEE